MTAKRPELDVVAVLKHSPLQAFDVIVDRYGDRIYWHIRRIVLIHEEAEDAMQETFVKAYLAIGGFRGETEGSLIAWLYKIATTQAIKALKRHRRGIFTPLDKVALMVADNFEGELSPSADEIAAKLQRAVVALPLKQRMVFNMRYYDELPFEAIAEATGMSPSSAKTNYHYAVQKVRTQVKNIELDDYETDALQD